MNTITTKMLSDPNWIAAQYNMPNDIVHLKLDDGNVVQHMPLRMVLLHGLLWTPYYRLGIKISINEIYSITAISTKTISTVQTIQYKHLIEITNHKHLDILQQLWDTIGLIYKFVHTYLSEYVRSTSLMSLINIVEHPEIKPIIDVNLPNNLGTKVAEIKFEELSKELLTKLDDPNLIKDNSLLPFLQSGVFNRNQIPQLLIAYGTRSDLDDQMQKHIINESALSGLKSAADYGVEALSAKKTSFYLKVVIASTQYFARVLRLNNMQFRKKYYGDCGSKYLAPITIAKNTGKNYIDKIIYYNGERIAITSKNYKEYENCRVEMPSPIGCKYNDGVCERCAGRATKHPWSFMPDLHLGSYAKSKLMTKISQKVLSAKHLVKCYSMEPKLFSSAKRYFAKKDNSNDIMFSSGMNKLLKNIIMVVPYEAINHIGDLNYDDIAPESFSLLEKIGMYNINSEDIEEIELAEPQFLLHFSAEMLDHIKNNLSEIELLNGNYHIPLKGFKIKNPVISYVTINDDMVAFAERIKTMICSSISTYSSASSALSDLANIIFDKTDINIFWLELIIKSLLSNPIDNDNDAQFPIMKKGISDSSVSSKLAHEDIRRYLEDTATTVVPKGDSPLDVFFGF
jgi:hypothetical protein